MTVLFLFVALLVMFSVLAVVATYAAFSAVYFVELRRADEDSSGASSVGFAPTR